ncbi:MAG TPA: DUF1080 domain-containing protein [Burkholderiales bacterium]|nr:DUF1080 domain-containing protein [Burkholderiales bacterium]
MKSTFAVLGFIAAAALAGCAHQPASGGGWLTLFDGSSLDAFDRVGNANWTVKDGVVQADKGVGFLVTKARYADFQVRAEFWADEDANSGIYMRCTNPEKITDESCYEANIFDKRPDPTYATGAVTKFAKSTTPMKAAGKWNTYEITAKGDHLVVVLNGVKTVDMRDGKFASGPIALQSAAGTIRFRKVEVRPL